MKKVVIYLSLVFLGYSTLNAQKIDRKRVVERHNVTNTKADTLATLTVGNGKFAYTVDITGMQSFPEYYKNGVSLGTQSEWGWNSFPNTENYKFEETLRAYDFNKEGRNALYSVQIKEPERNKKAVEYFRVNQHRLQLGNIGLELYKKDGSKAKISDLTNINQKLNLWTGIIESEFTVEGTLVKVWTAAYQNYDKIGVKIESDLIAKNRLKVFAKYPYPSGQFLDEAANYKNEENHTTKILSANANNGLIEHKLQTADYFTQFNYTNGKLSEAGKHYFVYEPSSKSKVAELSVEFAQTKPSNKSTLFADAEKESKTGWESYWQSGAAVDFEGSTDNRANELERRIVLSEYLTKVQCGGSNPPQETGLTFNSWYGKPHTEMHWWHGVHFALWGRPQIMENQLDYYFRSFDKAKNLAARQGYKGARWIKMSDNEGNESPSSVAAFLIWQQPHLIYMTELLYRNGQDKKILEKYKDLVFATADFMADFAYYDKERNQYMLKGIIPAQEVFPAKDTYNPPYELAYWDYTLRIAQEWKERLGQERDKKWDDVINKLAPLPVQDGVYLSTESAKDSFTYYKWMTDHPSVLGALGMVPESKKLDKSIMKNTLDIVWDRWNWSRTWGWDFPMTAMAAARLGLPNKALDALFMNIETNTYLKNGHNYQDDRLRIYLPGNGGVLTTVAMMLEGWDGSQGEFPGFPKDGSWKIKAEGFKKMP